MPKKGSMSVAVVGGNLQGVEASYLARKAGWKVCVIDKNSSAPASGLCDYFIQMDVTSKEDLYPALNQIDLVIPALENDDALESLERYTRSKGIPLAFDSRAYNISSSKVKSNRLFEKFDIPLPRPWPKSGFPVVVKPDKGSGSEGVRMFRNYGELKATFPTLAFTDKWVLQEFVCGPSYSLEVTGIPGKYRSHLITDLEMDPEYDCKRVVAPTDLSPELVVAFNKISIEIAEALGLKGIMDVEVVLHNGVIKVLEVDARLPSQTPTAVYWSTGRNLVEILGQLFVKDYDIYKNKSITERGIVYEHIRVSKDLLEIKGEHIMSGGGPLKVISDFFGADEAITNYDIARKEWVATLIVSGKDRKNALDRRNSVVDSIVDRYNLDVCDAIPRNSRGAPDSDAAAIR